MKKNLESLLYSCIVSVLFFVGERSERPIFKQSVLYDGSIVEEVQTRKAVYYGGSGRKVFEAFDSKITDVSNKLNKKHCFDVPKVYVFDNEDVVEGHLVGFGTQIILSSGCFLNETDCDEWFYAFLHEAGHKKYLECNQEEFNQLCAQANSSGITETFKEGLFEGIPSYIGHPEGRPTELYASAFVLAELSLIDKYKETHFPKFTQDQKDLAGKIFEMVQRK